MLVIRVLPALLAMLLVAPTAAALPQLIPSFSEPAEAVASVRAEGNQTANETQALAVEAFAAADTGPEALVAFAEAAPASLSAELDGALAEVEVQLDAAAGLAFDAAADAGAAVADAGAAVADASAALPVAELEAEAEAATSEAAALAGGLDLGIDLGFDLASAANALAARIQSSFVAFLGFFLR